MTRCPLLAVSVVTCVDGIMELGILFFFYNRTYPFQKRMQNCALLAVPVHLPATLAT